MKKQLISLFLITSVVLYASNESNSSENNQSILSKSNSSNIETIETTKGDMNSTQVEKVEKQLQEQIKREEKYAKEQTFYQGSAYDLSESEVDKSSLENIELPEPDYDFDMNDVYD